MIVQSGSKAKAFIEEIIHHFQRFVILEGGFSFRQKSLQDDETLYVRAFFLFNFNS
jgi:hypothetical protein